MRAGSGCLRAVPGSKGIDETRACPRNVLDVPGHDDEVALERSGSDQCIDSRNRTVRPDVSPAFCDGLVDFDDAVPELANRSMQPGFEHGCRGGISPAESLDSTSKLAHRKDAQKQLVRPVLSEPVDDARACTIPLPKLGQHIGVDEIGHSSTERNPEASRSKSASSPTSGMASKCSTNGSDVLAEIEAATCPIPISDNCQVPRGESSRR